MDGKLNQIGYLKENQENIPEFMYQLVSAATENEALERYFYGIEEFARQRQPKQLASDFLFLIEWVNSPTLRTLLVDRLRSLTLEEEEKLEIMAQLESLLLSILEVIKCFILDAQTAEEAIEYFQSEEKGVFKVPYPTSQRVLMEIIEKTNFPSIRLLATFTLDRLKLLEDEVCRHRVAQVLSRQLLN